MLKLVKYLKKSTLPIIIVVFLLIIQANSDLALPSYTSDIVNVGIQQGGISRVTPEVIRESQMNNALIFVSGKEKELILDSYKVLDKEKLSSTKYKDYVKDYPILKKEKVYKLNTKDKDTIKKLNKVFKDSFMMVYAFSSNSKDMKAAKEQIMSSIPNLPADTDIFTVLAQMPADSLKQITGKISEQFDAMPDTISEQTAIAFVKNEYKVIGVNVEKIQSHYIIKTGLLMIALAFVSMAATILVGFIAAKVAALFAKDLRRNVFERVVGFSNTEFDKFSTASLITRSTNDIQQIQMFMVLMIRIVFYAPILAFGGVVKVLQTNTSMAWIIAVAVGALLTLILILFSVAMPKFKSMQKLIDRLNLVTREILTGLSVIRAFSTEKYEEKRFDKANVDLTKTNLFVNRVMTFMMPLMTLIMSLVSILIVWRGAYGIDDGSMQVGDMMAFIQYTMQIIMSFLMLSMISIFLPRASVSGTRIAEVLNTEYTILEPERAETFTNDKKGYVEFDHVSFRYPKADEDVLTDISFVAKPGQTTAIIGSTGSGKSTLINLIPRFYDTTEGNIKVDGTDIKKVSLHDLRDKLGYVPQKGILFTGTIDSNIRYGKQDASEEDIIKAARIAQATEFIETKDEKYNTEISQGGNNVSGGQKQRLSIARAIAKDPEIYIFDDSFSALDYKTDVSLRKALNTEIGSSTVIIVAQRISTILHADQILVLDEGKIVGKGTHKELLKNCEVYNQIALSQLSKEELENE
ncbi:ABC transporter ATP-binding protein [Anaeromicropila herbilytica]|uniref:ABC transporter n=1 Tax=Anaeromicropila herbilytica TaxID=2785025 RepID=A0A7R7EN96_9FIRM|nr:ABC transporter ATP-binding protein [Anaeromicropila herbilytica]BCN31959.1 ABC transporter [Anaeromicropila herbilytica]